MSWGWQPVPLTEKDRLALWDKYTYEGYCQLDPEHARKGREMSLKLGGHGGAYAGKVAYSLRIWDDLPSFPIDEKDVKFPKRIEDFGIMPVECQAAGTPVIACGAGGALETVRPGRSGLFFAEQTVDALCQAIEEFEGRKWESALCRESAGRFTCEVFRRKFMLAAAPFLPPADEKR